MVRRIYHLWMDPIRQALDRAASAGLLPRGSSILLATSGGADSMALLYGAAHVAPEAGWTLSVGHVHHGWRGREADRDLGFVEEHARRLGFPFFHRRRDAREASKALGLSPEAGARLVRYEALHEIAREAGARFVATAHQQDDVLESHLLARRRRGGLALLAGPREAREDGVVRPILGVARDEILAFLAERGLAFRRDASNGDLRLSRTRVRREVANLAPRERRQLAEEVERLRERRDRVERDLAERVFPFVRASATESSVEASRLEVPDEELVRAALERLASPYARPGRPPMTGGEREQILRRLSSGEDFRFEAGRRIRFERRGDRLRIRPVPGSPVYDSRIDTSTGTDAGDAS
jgi:tRNA(Ile)-lysidine synthetase-like protein